MGLINMNGYDNFNAQIEEATKIYTKLKQAQLEDGRPILKGELDIIDIYGKYWETYQVEIHSSLDYPNRFPKVFEVGGKIPRIADWHIYENTNSCCLKVLPEELLICRQGITLISFIKNEVLPYFFNQTHRRIEGYYVNGEYSHGNMGIIEFYSHHLKVKDKKIIDLLAFIQKGIEPNRVSLCFCGSNKKYRYCHRDAYRLLSKLGQAQIRQDIETIYPYFI